MYWQAHISKQEVVKLLKWSHTNNDKIVRQIWRKDDPRYADSYARSVRQAKSQEAVME